MGAKHPRAIWKGASFMPVNVEIKARIGSVERMSQTVEGLGYFCCQILDQEDIFFHSSAGRLKLRLCSQANGELIFYERSNTAEPKPSKYVIYRSSDPQLLKEILSAAVGIVGVVRKRRLLYLVGQTRIHLDAVEELGSFIELEVVLQPGQTVEEGQQIALDLMDDLGIRHECLIAHAYVDMLCKATQSG